MKKFLFFPIVCFFVLGLAQYAEAQQRVIYDSFDACMDSLAGLPMGYYQKAARCKAMRPQARAPLVTPYGTYPLYPGSIYDNGYVPFWFDPCRSYLPLPSQDPGCVVAEVKFKILNRGLGDQVIVRVDGHNAGMIGKYSHPNTSGLRLRADTVYTITLEWVTKDGVKTIVDKIEPMAMRMQDGPYWYPISKALFDTAPYGERVTPERDATGGRNYIMGKEKKE